MATFEVAYIKEQGQDIIIVVVSPAVGKLGLHEQHRVHDSLQAAATSAGLAGLVALVWDAGNGQMGFLAPTQWNSYFQGLSLQIVSAKINRKLTVSG